MKKRETDFSGDPVVRNLPGGAGTWVQFLLQEDATYCWATKSVHHNYLIPCALESVLGSERSHCNERPSFHN